MSAGASLLSMYAGAMSSAKANGSAMTCFMLVGWFRVGDVKKLPNYPPMYIIILQINHFVLYPLFYGWNRHKKAPEISL
jgi:hypothetical protein